ncbi:sulfite exporter TauE/SafE family protein [Anaeromyxobacter sp. PSR-1]|uniref:sulfite exporter TauE/SafE family protein n=1 Tax=Anaeromyxobacter sp. PSR-1 TaxID=1300915 RepID=UPI0005DEF1AD|nr:sulfite exporter TauE/SafE family protein [Anaeromyxobacter sp. PSR-1]GAO01263.1 hypothetical protein PSR1_00116 [Anaeromyxobacter sp. PSR-1]
MLVAGLFVLSVLSGMLGLGVAFAAVPFLGIFLPDVVHQVQPLSLALNGLTAAASAIGFARSKLVDWRAALPLAVVTTVTAPLGAIVAQRVDPRAVWVLYFVSVAWLAFRLFRPSPEGPAPSPRPRLALALAVPISVLSGFLGVGPGFLLLPTLILTGTAPKQAAAVNAVAVAPPSFSALLPHIHTARWDAALAVPLLVAGAIGAFVGARLTSRYLAGAALKRMFAVLIVAVTLYKLWSVVSGG